MPPKADLLVVDDTPDNLRLLVGMLSEQGYKVRPVPNGRLAIAAAQTAPPDLILLDINMPEMNGYEVCRQLKADQRTGQIPIIFLSALNDVLDKVQAFQVGGVDYIAKPFQLEEVLARIETHLSICSLQRDLQAKNDALAQAVEELRMAQEQIIQSEKMAALGQLVANVAHEMNTPLGAIRSSVANLLAFLNTTLEQLPTFLQTLSPARQQDMFAMLRQSAEKMPALMNLSSRERRQVRRQVLEQLNEWKISDADTIADTLTEMGLATDLQSILPILQDSSIQIILDITYQLTSLRSSVNAIDLASDRASRIVTALKSYTRQNLHGQKLQADLIDGIETALTLHHNQLKYGVEVVKHYQTIPPISCYPDELSQVWTNLIHNALQAMQCQGTLTVEVGSEESDQQEHRAEDRWVSRGDRVYVRITDTGSGIPEAILPRIFEPFFTTKPKGEGSGLGLSIVQQIVKKHQGSLVVQSQPGLTTFTVSLPIV